MIDIGYSGCSITPIYEGNLLIHASKISDLGVKKIGERMKELILKHGEIYDKKNLKKSKIEEKEVTEKIISSLFSYLCVVSHKNSPNFTKKEPNFEISEKNNFYVVKLNEKFEFHVPINVFSHSSEVLFEGDLEGQSIVSLILDSLLRCSSDTRLFLSQNLVLKGGGVIYGIKSRILHEISHLSSSHPSYSSFSSLSSFFSFVDSSSLDLSWKGASMTGSVINYLNKKDVKICFFFF